MRVILYDPDDEGLIRFIHTFMGHLAECQDCQRIAREEGAEAVQLAFGALAKITSDDIPLGDYQTAYEFCDYWLDRHEMLSNLEMLTVVPIHGTC